MFARPLNRSLTVFTRVDSQQQFIAHTFRRTSTCHTLHTVELQKIRGAHPHKQFMLPPCLQNINPYIVSLSILDNDLALHVS
jgi:hypothetical protein